MNRKMIIYTLGKMIEIEGLLLLLPMLTGLLYHEKIALLYLAIACVVFFLGFIISRKKPKNTIIYAREGFVIVALVGLCCHF